MYIKSRFFKKGKDIALLLPDWDCPERWRGPPKRPHHRGLPVAAERMVGPEYCLPPSPPEIHPGGLGSGEGGRGGQLEKALGQAESGGRFQAWLSVQTAVRG